VSPVSRAKGDITGPSWLDLTKGGTQREASRSHALELGLDDLQFTDRENQYVEEDHNRATTEMYEEIDNVL
jgi:hypothetical protein